MKLSGFERSFKASRHLKAALRARGPSATKTLMMRGTKRRARAAGATRGAGSWGNKAPALLVKIHKGGQAGDDYSTRKGQLMDTNMLGRTPGERAQEWALEQAQHPRVRDVCVHFSVSAARQLELDDLMWKKIVRRQLELTGFAGCSYLAVRHQDTANDHLHVVVSRHRAADGGLVSTSQNFYKWREALRQVELEFGLEPLERATDRPAQTPASDRMANAHRRAQRRGTHQNWIDPDVIRAALAESRTSQEFALALKRRQIEFRQAEKHGRVTGILFRTAGSQEWLSASSVARDITLPKIRETLAANAAKTVPADAEEALRQARLRALQSQAQGRSASGQPQPQQQPRERG